FHVLNHNKRALALDLRDRVTVERLTAFILDHADVVLQNMRPGAVDKLGLGAAALRAKKPELIYCDLGAYGRTGPLKDRPGYDPLMQAHGGIMVAAGNDNLFRALCGAIAHMDLVADPRFATNSKRVENRRTLIPLLENIFRARPSAEWQARLDAAGVPAAPIENVAQVVAS